MRGWEEGDRGLVLVREKGFVRIEVETLDPEMGRDLGENGVEVGERWGEVGER